MPKRIFKKPTKLRGERAIKKSHLRILADLDRAKGKQDIKQIVSNWMRNKTAEQRQLLQKLERERVAKGKRSREEGARLAKEIDQLYTLGKQAGLMVFGIGGTLSRIHYGNRLNALISYRNNCATLISALELIKEKKLAYSGMLSKEERIRYFRDLPMPPQAELEMLEEYLGAVQKIVEMTEREPESKQWDQLTIALNTCLLALSKKHGV
ncbi:MAG: hypothetical protein Q7R70_01350 [Candidatus Diapherotrites archaeon]|nr:hypothetical protein [Candidatus Diapherotrites archaeon]